MLKNHKKSVKPTVWDVWQQSQIVAKPLFFMFVLSILISCKNTPPRHTSQPPYSSEPLKTIAIESTAVSASGSTQSNVIYRGYVCINPQSYSGKVVGDGHCVSLIKQCSKVPHTVDWKPGKHVLTMATNSIVPGTIIATFKNGRYPSRHGYHAAIYIEHNEHGIWVWDQWQGKAVHKRLITTRRNSSHPSNSAEDYQIVKRTTN